MITTYLDQQLSTMFGSSYTPVSHSEEAIYNEILSRLTSKKFRKWSLSDDAESHVRGAIKNTVDKGIPLEFVYPFGGYKAHDLADSPRAGWSEYFSILYCLKYVLTVAAIYEPGVRLVFSSDDFILERMNNIPKRDTSLYKQSFVDLIDFIGEHLPKNASVSFFSNSDLYENSYDIESELSLKIQESQDYYAKLDSQEFELHKKTAERNIYWSGAADMTDLEEVEKSDIVKRSLFYHGAYTHLSRRVGYNRHPDKIILSATPSFAAIPIGSTKGSVAKFWTGVGVVRDAAGRFDSRIVTRSQIKKLYCKQADTRKASVAMALNNNHNFSCIMVSENNTR